MTEPTYFTSAEEFRTWLSANHEKVQEILVGFYKAKTNGPRMTWSESVDVALCYGWIDAVRKSVDGERYTIRFTHRKKGSIWSKVNLRKIEELIAAGKMHPHGMAVYENRDQTKQGLYSFERPGMPELSPQGLNTFQENEEAWTFFEAQPNSYRKLILHWITTAKREETRTKRLAMAISESAAGKRYDPYNWPKPKP